MIRFAATALTVAGAMLAVGLLSAGSSGEIGWMVAGWSAAVAIGVASGLWLIAKHGSPGSGFVAAMASATAARFLAVGGGLIVALRQGERAPWMFLMGFAAGFVPVTVIEVMALRRAGKPAAGTEKRQGA